MYTKNGLPYKIKQYENFVVPSHKADYNKLNPLESCFTRACGDILRYPSSECHLVTYVFLSLDISSAITRLVAFTLSVITPVISCTKAIKQGPFLVKYPDSRRVRH